MTTKTENNGTIWKVLVTILLSVNVVLITLGANWISSAINNQANELRALNEKVTNLLVTSGQHETRLETLENK